MFVLIFPELFKSVKTTIDLLQKFIIVGKRCPVACPQQDALAFLIVGLVVIVGHYIKFITAKTFTEKISGRMREKGK